MTKTISLNKAIQQLPKLVENARKHLSDYIITVNGVSSPVIISADEYESRKETDEILADKKLMRAIRQGEKEIVQGKGIPWEQAKKELGWE